MEQKSTSNTIDAFLERKKPMLFYILLGVQVLFSILLFDGRLSFATDDSTYINNALAWIDKGTYPSFQGALYPLIISVLVNMFGVKILLIKFFSVIFMALGLVFFYKALNNRIPNVILFVGLISFAVNPYLLAYSSSTFSESLYMMMQSLVIWAVMGIMDTKNSNSPFPIKQWIFYALAFFLLTLTKNLALFTIVPVMVFLLLKKQWKIAGIALVLFVGIKFPYQALIDAKFGKPAESQTELLMRKDFNDPSQGKADLSDFQDRFTTNYSQYISIHIFKMLGIRGEGITTLWTFDKMKELQDESLKMEGNAIFSLLFLAFMLTALVLSYKDNEAMLFLILFVGSFMGITFLALHSFWNQDRLMVIYLPIVAMIFVYALYALGRNPKYQLSSTASVVLAALLMLSQIKIGFTAIGNNSKQSAGFRKGDAYYGYPAPIVSYIKNCEWIKNNITGEGKVLASKPVEATVFGGISRFIRMPNALPQTPDSMFAYLKEQKVKYILTDGFFGRTNQLAEFLAKNYPQKVVAIHAEGSQFDPSYLFEIKN